MKDTSLDMPAVSRTKGYTDMQEETTYYHDQDVILVFKWGDLTNYALSVEDAGLSSFSGFYDGKFRIIDKPLFMLCVLKYGIEWVYY